jgi:membrane protein
VTYGSSTAAIILLVWLWLTNVALMFGGEVNAQIERTKKRSEGAAGPELTGGP